MWRSGEENVEKVKKEENKRKTTLDVDGINGRRKIKKKNDKTEKKKTQIKE